MNIIFLTALLIGAVMLLSALFAIFTGKMIYSIIAFGVVSLGAALLLLIMKAPDVAITEASIGAGLTMAVFLLIYRRIDEEGKDG